MPALATGFRLPFDGSLTLTQKYGVSGGLKDYPTFLHLGEDYGGTKGTTIKATANGTVVAAAAANPSFGNYVVIEHILADQSKVYSLYAHLNSIAVHTNDSLFMEDTIGGLGNTGAADGYHLHFEISSTNQFTQEGIFGKGYDSPLEFKTSSKITGNPSSFINDHPVTNVQLGGVAADMLWGLSTGETLIGAAGNDTIFGNGGNDTLDGGTGNDTLRGGSGNDTYIVDSLFDTVSESVSGTNAADAGGTDNVQASVTWTLQNYLENLTLTGSAAISGTGNSMNNVITGNAASNVLSGGAGDDLLIGGAGNDTLIGGTGNDMLIGGLGKDALTGGAGNDIFDFNNVTEMGTTASNWDVINDFVRGADKVDLSTIDANPSTAADNAFFLISSGTTFTTPGQLKFLGGVLYGNTDIDSTPEFAIQLIGVSSITASDIIF